MQTILIASIAFTCVCQVNKDELNSSILATSPDQAYFFTNSISQYGITWIFDRDYKAGHFANGDYWIIGPVTIINITPTFDGTHHGWEVNPVYDGPQGFDERAWSFDSGLVPNLPYKASPGESIIKVVSRNINESDPRPSLQTAAVLTVVSTPPPDNGATVFRPPYVGTDKPYYSINDLNIELLPSLASVSNTPSLEIVYDWFKRVQVCHKGGRTGRYIRPLDNIQGTAYAPNMATYSNDAALRLMLNDPISEKMPVLLVFIQKGIDMYHSVLLGQVWRDGGGHQPGHKMPMAFAATLLDHQGMKDVIRNATFFHEDKYLYYGEGAKKSLFGGRKYENWDEFERKYWLSLAEQGTSHSERDPYGYIDGGYEPGGGYQFSAVSQPYKGSALAVHLMPAMKSVWPNFDELFLNYVDRWVNVGTWAQPDPCAPYDGDPDNYGITYGPDGNGDCIKGSGRLTKFHGTNVNGGYRKTAFQTAMWDTHRGTSPGN